MGIEEIVLSHKSVQMAIKKEARRGVKNSEPLAKDYIKSIVARSDFPAHQLLWPVIWFCTQMPFRGISVSSADIEKLRKASIDGSVAFATTHTSLFDTPIMPYLFRNHVKENEPVYIGGVNLINMKNGILKYLIRNSNTSFIDRGSEETEIPIVVKVATAHYFEHILKSRTNVVYFGSSKGCDKKGVIESRESPILNFFSKIVPVNITYEVTPEGVEYADRLMNSVEKPGRTFDDGLRMVNMSHKFGMVYVRVGDSIDGTNVKNGGLDAVIVEGLRSLVTITPASLFATAIIDSVTAKPVYSYPDLDLYHRILMRKIEARDHGFPMSPEVAEQPARDIAASAMKKVFSSSVSIGSGIQISNPGLVAIYSNQVAHYFGRKPLLNADEIGSTLRII